MSRMKALFVMALTLGVAIIAGCAAPAVQTVMNPVIVPHRANISMARVGIFCFRTPFEDSMLESQLAHQLHQLLLARQAARMVEVIPESFRDINEAIERARVLGYDVAVLGQLQEAFWGGNVEPSKATVDIRLVDTVRKITVWYLSSSARAKPRSDKDLILWRTSGARARTPMELVGKLLAQMSDRMVYETRRAVKTVAAPVSSGPAATPAQAPELPAPAPEVNQSYGNPGTDLGNNKEPAKGPLKIDPKPAG